MSRSPSSSAIASSALKEFEMSFKLPMLKKIPDLGIDDFKNWCDAWQQYRLFYSLPVYIFRLDAARWTEQQRENSHEKRCRLRVYSAMASQLSNNKHFKHLMEGVDSGDAQMLWRKVHNEFREESVRKITEVEQKSFNFSKSSDGLSLKTTKHVHRSSSGLHRVPRFDIGRRPEYDNGNISKRTKPQYNTTQEEETYLEVDEPYEDFILDLETPENFQVSKVDSAPNVQVMGDNFSPHVGQAIPRRPHFESQSNTSSFVGNRWFLNKNTDRKKGAEKRKIPDFREGAQPTSPRRQLPWEHEITRATEIISSGPNRSKHPAIASIATDRTAVLPAAGVFRKTISGGDSDKPSKDLFDAARVSGISFPNNTTPNPLTKKGGEGEKKHQ